MSMRKELLESAREVAERGDLAGYLVIGWNRHESASIRSNGNVPRSLITIVSRDTEQVTALEKNPSLESFSAQALERYPVLRDVEV